MKSTVQRRLALLIGAALVVSALAAPSAMAATTVKDAATGTLCPETNPPAPKTETEKQNFTFSTPNYVSGGCTMRMNVKTNTNPPRLRYETGEDPCYKFSYDIHIGPSGWGYVNNYQLQCTLFSWTAFRPVGPIMPVEYSTFSPFYFPDVNAETDFNSIWRLKYGVGGATVEAFPSLNVTQGNPLVWSNQATSVNANIKEGTWTSSGGLLVTH